ncbi:unnamed protein product [Phaedon cochleariae]|uniref:EF-hand domain-containing protein n=1 Tax=Phaedon cochleariae TaxID=80249 RepID=A0A9N9X1I7_PHACE|nr:unnamed protein product [Phaedon cochleariae]
MEEEEEIPVEINNDLEQKLADAFEIFDHAANKRIDLRDVSTIIRGLGCCPAEEDLQKMAAAMEDPDAPGQVHLSKFLPHVSQLIFEHKFRPATPEEILEAFRTLDVEGHGFLTKQETTRVHSRAMSQPFTDTLYIPVLMTQYGEVFNDEELQEMLELAVDPHTGNVTYEYYVNQLMHEPAEEDDIYCLADRIEAEKPPPPPPPRRMSSYLRETAEMM